MTRDEFKQLALKVYCSEGNDNWRNDWRNIILNDEEPFWIPEVREGWQANYFLVTRVMPCSQTSKKEAFRASKFYFWCKDNLSKVPMCFMSDIDNNKEWWGFNTEQDATLFIMRWS